MKRHSQGFCEWFKHNFEVPWVKLEQILQLKVWCSNYGCLRFGHLLYLHDVTYISKHVIDQLL